jgi:hypothetical protein
VLPKIGAKWSEQTHHTSGPKMTQLHSKNRELNWLGLTIKLAVIATFFFKMIMVDLLPSQCGWFCWLPSWDSTLANALTDTLVITIAFMWPLSDSQKA